MYDEVVPYVSANIVKQLAVGGKLIAPISDHNGVGNLIMVERITDSEVKTVDLTGNMSNNPSLDPYIQNHFDMVFEDQHHIIAHN